MNCDGVRPLLSAYIDQELSGGELLRVERHLRRCHWCAAEVDALRQTVALVASLDDVEVPSTFHAQLHQRLVSEDPPIASARRAGRGRSRLPSFRRWAIPAAAAAAFVIGVAGLNRVGPPVAQVEPPPGESVAVAPEPHVGTEEVPGTLPPPATSDTAEPAHHPANGPEAQPPSNTGGSVDEPSDPPAGQPGTVAEEPTGPALPAGEEDPGAAPAPLGPTSSGRGVKTASMSGETGMDADLPPQLQLSAMAEVTVADPAAEAERLRARLDEWQVQENARDGTVELQISVPAEAFREAVALLDDELSAYGAALAVQEKDLAGQFAETADRIAALKEQRDALVASLEGEVTQERLEQLDKVEEQLATEQGNFKNLREAVETSVIVLMFRSEPAR